MNWSAIVWFAMVVIFLILEALTMGITSLWFAAGSLGAMVVATLGGPGWLQLLVFAVLSCVLLAMLRPLARKHITPAKTNLDSVIGSEGYVTAPIDNLAALGQVKLGAMYWTARSTDGQPIAEGTRVRVDRIEGVKVFVTPVRDGVPC